MANGLTTVINALDQASGALSGASPVTTTRLSYGFTLHTAFNGQRPRVIGAMQSATFAQSRAVDDEYEVEASSNGRPVDQVPQALTTRTVTFERFDTYSSILESIFGAPEFNTLLDTSFPLVFREVWKDPQGFFSVVTRAYQYNGVVVTDYGRQIRASGDRIVVTNMTVRWNDRIRVI